MARSRQLPRRHPALEPLETRQLLSGPSAEAQSMLEWVNLARTNPTAAADRALSHLDVTTQSTLPFYHVNIEQTRREIAVSVPRQPLAWNDQLASAAQGHSEDQARTGVQSHRGSDGSDLGTRLNRAGYVGSTGAAENAFGYAQSVDNAMRAFLIDWGVADHGHRNNLLQPSVTENNSFRENGIGIAGSNRLGFGPRVITQDFGRRPNAPAMLLGVALDDQNRDRFYEPGEGRGGVTILATNLANGQSTSTQTWDAGGYQIPLVPGHYQVTAHVGNRLVRSQTVEIARQNVKLDFFLSDTTQPQATPPTLPVAVVPAATFVIPPTASRAPLNNPTKTPMAPTVVRGDHIDTLFESGPVTRWKTWKVTSNGKVS